MVVSVARVGSTTLSVRANNESIRARILTKSPKISSWVSERASPIAWEARSDRALMSSVLHDMDRLLSTALSIQ